MSLERVYRSAIALRRLRGGPLGGVLDGFCQWLLGHGYSHNSIRGHVGRMHWLSGYLARHGVVDSAKITWDQLGLFLCHYLPRRCTPTDQTARRSIARAVRRLREYLVLAGVICEPPAIRPAYQALLDEYVVWMRDYCHLSVHTLTSNRKRLIPFLEWLGVKGQKPERLAMLTPSRLQTFFLDYARRCSGTKVVFATCAVRTFLRFCAHRGYTGRDLGPAIPSFRRYRLSTLPRGITDEDAQKVLCSIERSTPFGRRDYSIVQLLYTYGIRAGQVSGLHLTDISWDTGQIVFRPLKRGKSVVTPLTDDVADALLAYLQRGRPPTSRSEVFFTARAPHQPISSGHVTGIVMWKSTWR